MVHAEWKTLQNIVDKLVTWIADWAKVFWCDGIEVAINQVMDLRGGAFSTRSAFFAMLGECLLTKLLPVSAFQINLIIFFCAHNSAFVRRGNPEMFRSRVWLVRPRQPNERESLEEEIPMLLNAINLRSFKSPRKNFLMDIGNSSGYGFGRGVEQ